MNSRFFNLGKNDFVKGLLLAVLTAIVTALYNAIEANLFEFTWVFLKPILLNAISVAMLYLLKNLLTNSKGETFKTETKNNM